MKMRDFEAINKKCLLLQELGFVIEHQDSYVSMAGIEFDFSATACDNWSIIFTAVSEAYRQGIQQGKNELKQDLHDLLKMED